jgi:hypothetical protein
MGDTMKMRLARAICCQGKGCQVLYETHDPVTGHVPVCQAQTFLPDVDCALAAMREPTEVMLRALPRLPYPSLEEKRYATDDWQAMIDAARNEQPDEEANVERSS